MTPVSIAHHAGDKTDACGWQRMSDSARGVDSEHFARARRAWSAATFEGGIARAPRRPRLGPLVSRGFCRNHLATRDFVHVCPLASCSLKAPRSQTNVCLANTDGHV